MQWLLVAMGVLIIGGSAALVTSGFPRLSTFLGALGAVTGCVTGLAGVVGTMLGDQQASLHLNWTVPYGSFSLELDPLSAFFALPVLVLSGLAAVYASRYVKAYGDRAPVGSLWFFYNLLVGSMIMVVLARNGILFLIAWEVMSLASFFLITFEDEKVEVREAGTTFLIATHLGTAFLLVLFVLLGSTSHSLEFADFSVHPSTTSGGLLFVLALIGFGTKAGLMPLHVWLPEAYPVAPSFVPAVMSGAMSKLGIYGLLRILLALPDPQPWWGWLLIGAGAISGVMGILSALGQADLKRLLAYSSIENIGIITMGLGLGVLGLATHSPMLGVLGFAGALLHVINHALFKGLLFLGAGVVEQSAGTRELDRLGGLLKRMPWTGSAFLIGSVAIAGLPPLNGFASEFLLYSASFGNEGLLAPSPTAMLSLAVIGALALIGGLAAYAFAKAFGIAFLGEPRTRQAAAVSGPGALMAGPILLLAGACICVGLCSRQVVGTLLPVVAQVTRQTVDVTVGLGDLSLVPLERVARMSSLLILVIGALAVARRALLAGRQVTASGTWGCGYSRPTPRIQYTASSFAQPALDFFASLFRSRKKLFAPHGLFPQSAWLATESSDLSQDFIYRPTFGSIGWVLSKLRWLQHGRVHVYILYVGCTILALMIWYASVELAPQPTPPPGDTARQIQDS